MMTDDGSAESAAESQLAADGPAAEPSANGTVVGEDKPHVALRLALSTLDIVLSGYEVSSPSTFATHSHTRLLFVFVSHRLRAKVCMRMCMLVPMEERTWWNE